MHSLYQRLIIDKGIRQTRPAYYKRVLNTQIANLVAYYPLWDSSGGGTAFDYSGNSYDGSYGSLMRPKMQGIDGLPCAGNLDSSTNSRLTLSNAGFLAAYPYNTGTIAMWVRFMAPVSTYAGFYGYRIDPNNEFFIRRFDALPRISVKHGASGVTRDCTINYPPGSRLQDWAHIAVTYTTGDKVKAYVNGKLNVESTSGVGTTTGTATAIRVCHSHDGGIYWNYTHLQHLGIWSVVLTADEIRSLSR